MAFAITGKALSLTMQTTARGLRTQGDAELNRYDPPWTPPFLRRNEVWTALEG